MRNYFRKAIREQQLPLIENNPSLSFRRHLALFMCVLQMIADVVAMGLASVRGQVVILVVINLILISVAVGGVFGAVTISPMWNWAHAIVSLLLSLMLIGVGVADVFLEKEDQFLRLFTLFPVFVDIAAGVVSFLFSNTAIRAQDRREEILEEREIAAQAEQKIQFERNKEKRKREKEEREAAREAARADGSSTSSESTSLAAGNECVVCLASPKDAILMPCHHVCTCLTCAEKLDRCPLCRASVTKAERVFL